MPRGTETCDLDLDIAPGGDSETDLTIQAPRSETTWPMLQRLLDEALERPKGLRVPYETWQRAEVVRNQMGKFRRTKQITAARNSSDPSTPYDGITMYIDLRVSQCRIEIDWVWPKRSERLQVELDEAPHLLSTPITQWPSNFRSILSACSVKATVIGADTKSEPLIISATNAPSFSSAWKAIHRRLPAYLVLEKTYNLGELQLEDL